MDDSVRRPVSSVKLGQSTCRNCTVVQLNHM